MQKNAEIYTEVLKMLSMDGWMWVAGQDLSISKILV